ncbi:hypothetical protein KM043_010939 [Ampulex compressa]|nr:hypothetical protein KM043_010939 [Ampulex compressa]
MKQENGTGWRAEIFRQPSRVIEKSGGKPLQKREEERRISTFTRLLSTLFGARYGYTWENREVGLQGIYHRKIKAAPRMVHPGFLAAIIDRHEVSTGDKSQVGRPTGENRNEEEGPGDRKARKRADSRVHSPAKQAETEVRWPAVCAGRPANELRSAAEQKQQIRGCRERHGARRRKEQYVRQEYRTGGIAELTLRRTEVVFMAPR